MLSAFATQFRQSITEAACATIKLLVSSFGETGLYGFALYTVDDFAGIVPSASFETGFHERRSRLLSDQKRCDWLTEREIGVDRTILGDSRWSIYEWEHECFGIENFAHSNEILKTAIEKIVPTDDSDADSQFSAIVLSALVLGLHDVAMKNEICPLIRRNSTTVFCSMPNSTHTNWLERESAKFLNSNALFDVFSKERISWITDDFDERYEYRNQVLPLFKQKLNA